MKTSYSSQYGCCCLHITAEDMQTLSPDDIDIMARENHAVCYPEGPTDPHFCLQIKERPKELYTERPISIMFGKEKPHEPI